ncbi:MAG: alcohol dehydrogenase catalytic domain-containing protein [Candidatus Lernaella stagnicola]|nr:alcohol dehydrogenase catalytic domain-containing protein [Candidatus Lernaella stagnicola]
MKALYFDNSLPKIAVLKALSLVDKFAALGRFSPVQYAEVPEPSLPNERWLKVRNLACGLCGTDMHLIFMDMDPKTFYAAVPGIERKFLGHELVAEVVEVGRDAGDWQLGERVAMRIDWPSCYQLEIDPPCPQCAAGSYMLCENVGRKPLPLRDMGGGFSPYMVMHRTQPFRLPKDLPTERAVLVEPTASAMHGVLKADVKPGDRVLVIGAGTIGLLAVAITAALHPEAEVSCLARYPFQAEAAKTCGAGHVLVEDSSVYQSVADKTGARYIKGPFGNEILLGGYDVIYDTVGNDNTLHNALRWTKAGGQLVLLGINFKPGKIDYSPIWSQEIRVTGINCHGTEADGVNSFEKAAQLLTDPSFAVDHLVTHRFTMDQYKDAIHTFLNKRAEKAIKIVLEHPQTA